MAEGAETLTQHPCLQDTTIASFCQGSTRRAVPLCNSLAPCSQISPIPWTLVSSGRSRQHGAHMPTCLSQPPTPRHRGATYA